MGECSTGDLLAVPDAGLATADDGPASRRAHAPPSPQVHIPLPDIEPPHGATEADHLSQVLSAIYDAALDPDRWPAALGLATAFLDGAAANLFWQDPVSNRATVFHAFGDDPAYTRSYFERYADLNPYFPAIAFIPAGVVFSGGDVIPHDEIAQTRFFREWVAPQGFIDVVGVNLHRFTAGHAAFSVRRSRAQGYVDAQMRRRTALLAPHLQRAVMIGREFEGLRAGSAAFEAVLDRVTAAVFLVDAAGRLLFHNAAGRALLEAGGPLGRRRDGLHARDRTADAALRAAFAACATPDPGALRGCPPSIALTDARAERHLAHVLPLSDGTRRMAGCGAGAARAAVFVRRAEIPVAAGGEVLARLYGLTAGEVRVLQAATTLGPTAEIAAALGVAAATVKTHLASLFDKTGTRRRSELVGAVAAHGSPLG